MVVNLRYLTTSAETSDWSVGQTFLCANVPDAPNAPTSEIETQDIIIVDWASPSTDGGSAILGYQLFMKLTSSASFSTTPIYDGSEDPNTKT